MTRCATIPNPLVLSSDSDVAVDVYLGLIDEAVDVRDHWHPASKQALRETMDWGKRIASEYVGRPVKNSLDNSQIVARQFEVVGQLPWRS